MSVLQKDNRLIVVDEGEGFVSLALPPSIHNIPDITAAQKRYGSYPLWVTVQYIIDCRLEAINEDVKRLDLQAKKTPWYIQRTVRSTVD